MKLTPLKLSIRSKIFLAFCCFSVLILICAWVVIEGQKSTSTNFDSLIGYNKQVDNTNQLVGKTIALQRDVLIYKETGNLIIANKIEKNINVLQVDLDLLKTSINTDQERSEIIMQMQARLDSFHGNFQSVVENRGLRRQFVSEYLITAYEKIILEIDSSLKTQNVDHLDSETERLKQIKYLIQLSRSSTLQFLRRADSGQINIVKTTIANALLLTRELKSKNESITQALSKIQNELSDHEEIFLNIVQSTRAYLYLINVVMAADLSKFIRLGEELNRFTEYKVQLISIKTHKDLTQLGNLQLFGSTFAVSIALLLAWILSEVFVAPIAKLTEVFRSLSEGRYVDTIPGVDRRDEFGEMAAAANIFRSKNQDTIRLLEEIKMLNQELETRVENRTLALEESTSRLALEAFEHKRTNIELETAKEQLELTLKVARIGTWIWDYKTNKIVWDNNNHILFGLKSGEFKGGTEEFYEMLHPGDRERIKNSVSESVQIGDDYDVQYRVIWPDGSEHFIASRGNIYRDKRDNSIRRTGVSWDVTKENLQDMALAQAKEAAESASLAKSQFLANMSHELRTPLNAIIGYSEMLVENASETFDLQSFSDLEKIQMSGKHLLELINDILDLSKIESGRMELSIQEFWLKELIEDVIASAQPLIDRNSNTVILQNNNAGEVIRSDSTKIRQILFNLISNAAKFTHEGQIILSIEDLVLESLPHIKISIKDNGIGISAVQQSRLFQPFMQADESTTRHYGGTGLGLSICRRLCDLLGGHIEVESLEGGGSTFIVTLPTDLSMTHISNSLPVIANNRKTTKVKASGIGFDAAIGNVNACDSCRKTVLVIDDDGQAREILSIHLQNEGWRVISASDGEMGLLLAQQTLPTVITLDVCMPDMNGWTVLQHLKGDKKISHIPVIMCSMLDEKRRGFALGATDYLLKPVTRKQLVATIGKYLDSDSGHVLVVEDEASARELLVRNLSESGWDVSEAVNGKAALHFLAESRPDIVLLDLMMPEIDGFSVIEEMQNNNEWKSIPVIVITAKTLTKMDRKWLDARVSHIMQKGQYSKQQLLDEISGRLSVTLAHLLKTTSS